MEVTLPGEKLGLILRVGMFVFLAFAGMWLIPALMYPLAGYFLAAALGTFAAAAIANTITLRVFERGRLVSIGLGWQAGSSRNLALGLLGGVGAACIVLLGPLAIGSAELYPTPDQPASLASLAFVSVGLLFGAIGEELLFRGYGFQLLIRSIGRFATILPISVLFSLAHANNENISTLGLINTAGFGIVLGYAFTRSNDLWLPIGIHFGWNWVLPLFGLNLSGFTMSVSGYTMRWNVGELWSGGNYGPEGSLLTSIIIIALVVYLAKAPVQPQPIFLEPRET